MLCHLRYVTARIQSLKGACQLSKIAQASLGSALGFLMAAPLNKKHKVVPNHSVLLPRAVFIAFLLEFLH